MTISGNLNSATIAVERARAGGHEPLVLPAVLAGDGETWPAGLVMGRGADGKWLPHDTEEDVAVGTGDGTNKTFALALGPGVKPGTVTVTDETEDFADNGLGTLTGNGETTPGTGSIDYATGVGTVTFKTAPTNAQAVTGTCKHLPAGVLDEKTETTADTDAQALVIRHGTVKLSMLVTDADDTAATAAVIRQLEAAGVWAV